MVGTSSPAPSALLRLPPNIRRDIYLLIGVTSPDGEPLVYNLRGRKAAESQPPTDWYGLLLSCRAMYLEISALLYSANSFIIHYTIQRSLRPLRALTPASLAAITNLEVVIKESPLFPSRNRPPTQRGPRDPARREEETGLNIALSHNKFKETSAVVTEWVNAANTIFPCITPGRVNFNLVCDIRKQHHIRAISVASRVVSPLEGISFKNCHIRLAESRIPEIRQVARNAALGTLRRPARERSKPPSSTSRLLTLPRELRLCILEYTDLITPWKEVSWSRQSSRYSVFHTPCAELEGHQSRPDIHHGCQFRRCWLNGDPLYAKRFCQSARAAFSSSCRCWTCPGPNLFLICRTLCNGAQFVFFSGNRFVVHDYYDMKPSQTPMPRLRQGSRRRKEPVTHYLYERLAAAFFLEEVVPAHCLAYLRFLDIVFPPYAYYLWPKPNHPALVDWEATIGRLAANFNLPGLTIRLTVAQPQSPVDYSNEYEKIARYRVTKTRGEAQLAAYAQVMRPLKRLAIGPDGLARFYAHLMFPWGWAYDGRSGSVPAIREQEKKLKRDAEKDVMGDRYDDMYAHAKGEQAQAIWHGVWYGSNGFLSV
ncbi:hypothetical protein B0J18DRAFT_421164 [Chaetomium sp. MPI-SDFR-AT-0129]|nr:hypothetical protein B0J18DRAFT_421164 [Chaetomium sp. MPI-SDFR-AT-0129]